MNRYKLSLTDVSSKYGAPMGRANSLPEDRFNADLRLHLVKMRFVDGDYDTGGAYWGGNSASGSMYCADGYVNEGQDNEEAVRIFVRGRNREESKKNVRSYVPNAKFYR